MFLMEGEILRMLNYVFAEYIESLGHINTSTDYQINALLQDILIVRKKAQNREPTRTCRGVSFQPPLLLLSLL